jgi:outer membrane usher protein
MPSLSRRAAKGFFAFAAGVAALTGSSANAQADPFALPKTTTASAVTEAALPGPGLSEIEIDGRVNARLVEIRGSGNALTIDADGARAAGLPVDATANGQIRVDALKLYQWRFDTLRQRLVIKLFRNNDGPNFRDFASRDNKLAQRDTITALRVDYDMNAVFGRSGVSVAGIGSAALVKGDFAAVTTARVAVESTGRPARVQRLDSFVQIRLPRSSAVATAGDFISAGSVSQRPLRMGGLQIASDFTQQPDLVTSPMPAFSGSVAVPTTLDILTADQRFQLGKLEPGEFTVRNIPLNPGRGSMSVLLKDSLGREVVRNVSFYLSNTLLREGLDSFAVNAGFVRRRYGIEGDNYGPLAASAYYRRGLSSFLTLEASAESTAGLLNIGSRADFTIGNVALSSLELRTSRDSTGRTGNLLNASLESIGRGVSGRMGVSLPTANYRDVASHLGDKPPPKQFFANIAFDLRQSMPLQLSYVRQDYAATPGHSAGFARRNELLSANLFYSPSPRVNFSLNGGFRQAQTRSFFVTAGVSIRVGPRHAVSLSGSEGAGQTSATLAYQYNDHQNSGLRAQATVGALDKTARITASAIHEGRWTTLNGGVVAAGGDVAGQLSATGTLIATGGTVYARGQSNNGYALVRAGDVEGIPVKLEHRFVGKTDRNGRLLVQNLRTSIPQRIDVDGTQLPADAVVLTSRHVISVPTRAIGLVDIDAMYYRPVVLQIVDQTGVALEPGVRAIASPSGRETLVGFDGTVEFNTASGDRALLAKSSGGDCRVVIPDDAQLEALSQPLVCQPVAQIAETEQPAHSLEGAKVARRN